MPDVVVPAGELEDAKLEAKKGKGGNDVLNALDNAGVSRFHFKAIVVSGMGFFADAYDLYCIGLMTGLIGDIYYNGAMPLNIKSALNGVALCGTLAGQLFFGWAGDKFGRKAVYGLTLGTIIVSALAQAHSFGRSTEAVMASLCLFRFLLGVGIGGDYPLSATIMSEYSSKSSRGAFVSAVFAMQGVGYLAAATVALIVTAIFSRFYPQTAENADFVWRIVLAFSALPTALTMYARSKMPETPRFTMLVAQQQSAGASIAADIAAYTGVAIAGQGAAAPVAPAAAAPAGPAKGSLRAFLKSHGKYLVGTTMSWFLLDVAFYSQGLFQSDVFRTVAWVPSKYNVQGAQAQEKFFLAYSGNPSGTAKGLGYVSEDTALQGHNHYVNLAPRWDMYYPTRASALAPYWNTAAWGAPPSNLDVSSDPAVQGGHKTWWTPVEACWYNARAQAIIALGSTIPGYWFTVFTIERIGRWWIQMFGFFFMTLFMAVIAGAYNAFVETPADRLDLLARSCFVGADHKMTWGRGHPVVVPAAWDGASGTAYVQGPDGLWGVNPDKAALEQYFKAEGAQYALGRGPAGEPFTTDDVKQCIDWRQNVKLVGNPSGFIVLYALTFFFANWGPNSTTFVVPAEIFPARWRATAHGLSAAMGKLGAIIGAFGFVYAASEPSSPDCHDPKDIFGLHNNPGNPQCGVGLGLRVALGILAITNGIGMIFTFLVPESKGMSLEELGGEEEAGRVQPELGQHAVVAIPDEDAKPAPGPAPVAMHGRPAP